MAQKQETALQNDIRVKLSEVGIVVRNNVGKFFTTYGAPIAIGVPGMSDLTLYANGGKTIFIEVKTLTGKQREQQKRFQEAVENLGYEYLILRSIEEAENLCLRLRKSKC
jgi:hypothetical protein